MGDDSGPAGLRPRTHEGSSGRGARLWSSLGRGLQRWVFAGCSTGVTESGGREEEHHSVLSWFTVHQVLFLHLAVQLLCEVISLPIHSQGSVPRGHLTVSLRGQSWGE